MILAIGNRICIAPLLSSSEPRDGSSYFPSRCCKIEEMPENSFLLFVDTCMDEGKLGSLKETFQLSLLLLPTNTIIRLIRYGKMVNVG